MDLIYTNPSGEDVGVLLDYDFDMAFGSGENDFECTIQSDSHCCTSGSFLYIEGTEFGGIVDSIRSNNETKEVTYSGRTWHGILNSKVIEPDSGEAYLVLSGEANEVIGKLLARMSLSSLFEASSEDSGITITDYRMHRYITGYDGIIKMLKAFGGKLLFTFQDGKIILSAAAKHDYSGDDGFDSDLLSFEVTKKYKAVNHLVCLGSGELTERMVVHLYADASGKISQTQTQDGTDEYAAVYNYPNVESEEELIKSGTERLKELWEPARMSIDLDADGNNYDVGDTVGAVDNITSITVSAEITKKIVTIKNGRITISYKVGED